MAAMTWLLSAPLAETTSTVVASRAAAASALTRTTAATALARVSRLVVSCCRRSLSRTKTVTTDTIPTARAKTMTKASDRRPWKVLGRARETGTERPRLPPVGGRGVNFAVVGFGDPAGDLPEERSVFFGLRFEATSALRGSRSASHQDHRSAGRGWRAIKISAPRTRTPRRGPSTRTAGWMDRLPAFRAGGLRGR